MSKLFLRYLIFIVGLYFLSLGIVLIVSSTLGTTPISSVNYVVSSNTPISLGTATFLINVLLILGQFWLVRGVATKKDILEIVLQIPFSFIFSVFIDFNMALFESVHPENYIVCLLLLVAGCLSQSVGVVLELKPNVSIMSAEGFVKYASRRYGIDFGKFKVRFDVTLVTTAIILSLIMTGHIDGVREGTVVAALATGYIVMFLSKYVFTRSNILRLRHFVHV